MKLLSPLSAAHGAEPSGVMSKLRVLVGRNWGMFFPTDIITHSRVTRSHEDDEEPRETLHATPDGPAGNTATSARRAAHSFHLPRFRSGFHHVNSNF
jgi:NADH:ubiquinone reductase (H+-translocating)